MPQPARASAKYLGVRRIASRSAESPGLAAMQGALCSEAALHEHSAHGILGHGKEDDVEEPVPGRRPPGS